MPVPASASFNVCDWNSRYALTTDAGDRSLSDGVDPVTAYSSIYGPTVTLSNDFLYLHASGTNATVTYPSLTRVVLNEDSGLPTISGDFTLEYDVYLTDELPKTLAVADGRLFVGVRNSSGDTSGLLFSYQGIASAKSVDDAYPELLARSGDFLFNEDGTLIEGVSVRVVVDATTKRATIYIAPTEAAYEDNADYVNTKLAYSIPTHVVPDSCGVFLSAQAAPGAGAVYLAVGSLRVSTYKLIPEERPVAVIRGPHQVGVGALTQLQGGESYDPQFGELSYDWEIGLAPEGSTATLTGASFSEVGVPVAAPEVLLSFVKPTENYNGYELVVTRGTTLQISVDDTNSTINVELASGPITSIVGEALTEVPTADGAKLAFNLTLASTPVYPGSVVSITNGVFTTHDDGSGNLAAVGNVTGGTVDYNTGVVSITFSVAPAAGVSWTADYSSSPTTTYAEFVRALSNPSDTAYCTKLSGGYVGALFVPRLVSAELTSLSAGTGYVPIGTYTFSGGAGSTEVAPSFTPDVAGLYVFTLRVYTSTRSSTVTRHVALATAAKQLLAHKPNVDFIFKHLSDFWNLVPDKDQVVELWSAVTQVASTELLKTWQNDYAKSLKDISRRYQRRWLQHPLKTTFYRDVSLTLVSPDNIGTYEVTPVVDVSSTVSNRVTVPAGYSFEPFNIGKVLFRGASSSLQVTSVSGVTSGSSGTWNVDLSVAVPTFKVISAGRTAGVFIEDPAGTGVPPILSRLFSDAVYNETLIDPTTDVLRIVGTTSAMLAGVASVTDGVVELASAGLYGVGVQPVDGKLLKWDHLRAVEDCTLQVTPYFTVDPTVDLTGYRFGDVLAVSIVDPYTAAEVPANLPILAIDGQDVFVAWEEVLAGLNVAALSHDFRNWQEKDLQELAISLTAVVRTSVLPEMEDLVDIPILGSAPMRSDYVSNLDYKVINNQVCLVDWVTGVASIEKGTKRLRIRSASYHSDVADGLTNDIVTEKGIDVVYLTTGDVGPHFISSIEDGDITVASAFNVTDAEVSFRVPRFSFLSVAPDSLWAELSYFDNWQTIESHFGLFIGFPKELVESYSSNVDYLSLVKGAWFAFVMGPSIGNMELGIHAIGGLPYTDKEATIIQIIEPTPTTRGSITVEDTELGRQSTFTYNYGMSVALNDDGTSYKEGDTVAAYKKLVDGVQIEDYVSNPTLVDSLSLGLQKYHTFVVEVPFPQFGSTATLELIKMFLQDVKPAHTNFILYAKLALDTDIVIEDDTALGMTLNPCDTLHTSPFHMATKVVLDLLPSENTLARGWGAVDITEKYESGYAEGILDDYSGDGSWNSTRHVLDMVNTFDSDIDVVNSRIWVPVVKVVTGDDRYREFAIGETVTLWRDGFAEVDGPWKYSPPVVLHVGAGVHPKITGHVFSPQNAHPYTYFLLGFNAPPGVDDNLVDLYGAESRLDAIKAAVDGGGVITIVGNTSGATATLDTLWNGDAAPPDRLGGGVDHECYFLLEHLFSFDKLNEWNVKSEPTLTLTRYVPFAGINVGGPGFDWQLSTPTFLSNLDVVDEAVGVTTGGATEVGTVGNTPVTSTTVTVTVFGVETYADVVPGTLTGSAGGTGTFDYSTGDFVLTPVAPYLGGLAITATYDAYIEEPALTYRQQLQQHPYQASLLDTQQYVPSWGPGAYVDWADRALNQNLVWGYEDNGKALTNPQAITAFLNPAAVDNDVVNTHVGMRWFNWPEWHLTHGFTTFTIPAPRINCVVASEDGAHQVRICGSYFCEDDPSRVAVPTSDPTSFDGNVGGSWVFFRCHATGIEYPVSTYAFETGANAGRKISTSFVDGGGIQQFVLGDPQLSDGHVLEVDIPVLGPAGYYDIVVRNYRRYYMDASDVDQYHFMDEFVAEYAVFMLAAGGPGGGWGLSGWGTSSYGGT